MALPELVEAAARGGDAELAGEALERLAETTQPCGTNVALGIEARCRALLSDGAAAEELYHEAIDRFGRTRLRPELVRAHLLYGEWLRREGRRVDAREQLRIAHDLFLAIGMEAFAERAGRELVATGEKVPKSAFQNRSARDVDARQAAGQHEAYQQDDQPQAPRRVRGCGRSRRPSRVRACGSPWSAGAVPGRRPGRRAAATWWSMTASGS